MYLTEVCVGDVVQIDPEHDKRFGGSFMLVTELKPSWNGLVGFIQIPGSGQAYYRVPRGNVRWVGVAEWTLNDAISD